MIPYQQGGMVILGVVITILLISAVLIGNLVHKYPFGTDYSKDKYIDYWNDMWAECEFGERNYDAVRREYGIS